MSTIQGIGGRFSVFLVIRERKCSLCACDNIDESEKEKELKLGDEDRILPLKLDITTLLEEGSSWLGRFMAFEVGLLSLVEPLAICIPCPLNKVRSCWI